MSGDEFLQDDGPPASLLEGLDIERLEALAGAGMDGSEDHVHVNGVEMENRDQSRVARTTGADSTLTTNQEHPDSTPSPTSITNRGGAVGAGASRSSTSRTSTSAMNHGIGTIQQEEADHVLANNNAPGNVLRGSSCNKASTTSCTSSSPASRNAGTTTKVSSSRGQQPTGVSSTSKIYPRTSGQDNYYPSEQVELPLGGAVVATEGGCTSTTRPTSRADIIGGRASLSSTLQNARDRGTSNSLGEHSYSSSGSSPLAGPASAPSSSSNYQAEAHQSRNNNSSAINSPSTATSGRGAGHRQVLATMGAVPLLSEQDGDQQHGASSSVFVSAAATQQLTASSSSCCSSSSSSSSAAASSATTASAPGAVWGGGATTTTTNSLSSTSGSGATTGLTPTGMPLPAATIFHNTGAGSCTTSSGVNSTSRGGTGAAMGGGGLLAGTTTSSTSSTSSVIFTAVTTPSGGGGVTSSSATNRMSSNSSTGGGTTSGPPALVHNNFISAAHTPKSSELSNSQTRVNAARTPPNCGSETPPAVGHSSSRNSNHGDSNIMGTSGDLNKSKRILRLFSPLQGPGRYRMDANAEMKKKC